MNYKNEGSEFLEKTRSAFLWTRLLNIPFWAIYNMLVIILYKDLHATPLQSLPSSLLNLSPHSSLLTGAYRSTKGMTDWFQI